MADPVCDQGMMLRLGGEQTFRPLRVVLYLLLLGWCFMGVAIIADVFMVAIERITSRKARRFIEGKNRYVTVTVWNPTVANLTLMALGSSAPEILINVIEFFRDGSFNGPEGKTPLGPSTIVGSAAFNLFVIIAVCVSVIPDGEVRMIKEFNVYLLTAAFSIFAYIWLLVILMWRTPHAVEIWEGVLTFLFFPMLVLAAFCTDKGYIFKSKDHGGGRSKKGILAAEMTKEELAELENRIRKDHGEGLSEDQVAKFVQIYCGEQSSRAKYRIAATRAIVGGKRVQIPNMMERKLSGLARLARNTITSKKVAPIESHSIMPIPSLGYTWKGSSASVDGAIDDTTIIIEFSEMKKAVLENAGFVTIVVTRVGGDTAVPCCVDYKTRDGTAHCPSDYVQAEGTLEFGPYELTKTIQVVIVDDFSYEENEEFYIDLSNPRMSSGEEASGSARPTTHSVQSSSSAAPHPIQDIVLGIRSTLTVVIVDDDVPGIISFPEDDQHVAERVHDHEVSLVVQRKHGSVGKVTCRYRFEDVTAKAGLDYEAEEGTLEFAPQEIERTITVKIKARGRYEQSEHFRVILEAPLTGGAKFDPETDGGADSCILTVFIECEKVARDRVDRLMSTMQQNWERAKLGNNAWFDQFRDALLVNGGDEDGDGEDSPLYMDYAMHFVTVPWKVLFAFCPPPTHCGGWLTFWVALGFIGFVTALITDLANLLGCTLEMCNAITAITLVALGTSLPDTFASKVAATQDPYADASIVNVTGSNSVNVFLGLGLPWMMGSIKWVVTGKDAEWISRYGGDEEIALDIREGEGGMFIVKAGDLGFSVGVFTACAFVCIAVLALRRRYFRGELGGPRTWKYITSVSLVSLWLTYVSLSSWKAMSATREGYC